MSGLDVLEELKRATPTLAVLMITAFASVETAITAMKKGAFDYVTKPFKHEEVLHILAQRPQPAAPPGREPPAPHRAQGPGPLHRDRGQEPEDAPGLQPHLPGRALALHHPGGRARAAPGKELVAKAIHANSPAGRQALRRGQLRKPAPRSPRVEPLRPREGCLHGGDLREEGALRAGRQGHALLRRDRQHSPRDPGQAAARDAGARVHAARRGGHRQGGRAGGGRHQRRPSALGRGGALPRRPLLPAQRDRRPAAPAPATQGGRARARAATSWRSTRRKTASRWRA